jgi:hypothetical protein
MVEDLIRLFVGKKWRRRLDFATLEKVSERRRGRSRATAIEA